MEKFNNKGSSAKLKHRLTWMLLGSSCTTTTTIAEAAPDPCTDFRYRNSRPSRATDDHRPRSVDPVGRVKPLFFLMNKKENDKEKRALIESVSPSEGKQRTKEASERKKKKKKTKKKKQKVLFDAYEFTSSSSLDSENDHDLFSSDEEEKDEDESGTLFSSKSFSTESSEFYHSSRKKKKKKKNTRRKSMKSTRRPPRRHVKHSQEPQPLVSISSSEKETKPEAAAYIAGFPVVKRSTDPYGDFRSSMAEMIVERGMSRARDLERLLHAYLHLNSPCQYQAILEAFSDVCEAIFGK
ncbi:transcription repressor OFP2-like [Musa acuminata AAA Group]|uniref:transcription repressor OFP2-like n=1 Tax=Musa acuminata AAA Group TaxID=214697 RepID=UPI0031DCDACB